jgi:hypothetical protein
MLVKALVFWDIVCFVEEDPQQEHADDDSGKEAVSQRFDG